MTEGDTSPQPAPRASPDMPPPPRPHDAPPQGAAETGAPAGFEFNNPTVISLLYLSAFVLGVTGIVGIVLAYVWKGETHAEWESSHYAYHIRTFWLGLIGMVAGALLLIVLIGFLIWLATAVLVVVRCVLALVNAQKHQPMPNPDSWLA